MLTVIVLGVLVAVGLVGLVGGVVMMFDDKAGFWSWYLGYNAFTSGLQVIGQFLPAFLEAVATLVSSLLNDR